MRKLPARCYQLTQQWGSGCACDVHTRHAALKRRQTHFEGLWRALVPGQSAETQVQLLQMNREGNVAVGVQAERRRAGYLLRSVMKATDLHRRSHQCTRGDICFSPSVQLWPQETLHTPPPLQIYPPPLLLHICTRNPKTGTRGWKPNLGHSGQIKLRRVTLMVTR